MRKKILCIIMSLMMIIAYMPQGAYAEESGSADVTYLAFSADIHNQSGNASVNRMINWIDNVTDITGAPFDRFGSCGDMGPASGTSDNFFNNAQLVMDVIEKDRKSDFEDGGFYVCGNHEYKPGSYTHDKNSTTKKYSDAGEYVIDEDGYIMYSLGSTQWNEVIQDSDISSLEAFLTEHNDYKNPIFILTHFPLHRWSSKSGTNETSSIHDGYPAAGSKKLIEVLNSAAVTNGQNIIFLWGHNHSSSAEFYDAVYTDKINETPIYFTYASAGAMADSEYASSAKVKGKGLVAAIEGTEATLTYYTESGAVVGSPVTVGDAEIGEIEEGEEDEADSIAVTPVSSNSPSVGCTLEVGETVLIDVTNSSSYSSYTFSSTSSDEGVAKVVENASVAIAKAGTAKVKVEAVSGGTATITIQNNNSRSNRIAYVNITVKDNAEQVVAAKETAKKAVKEAAGEAYSEDVGAIISAAMEAIDSAKSVSAVETAEKAAIDKVKKQIKKEEEEAAAKALQKIKDGAEAEAREYAGTEISDTVEAQVEKWIGRIESASSEEEVLSLLESAKKAIDEQKLQDARDEAINSLYGIAGDNISEEMKALLDDFEEEIQNAASEEEIGEIAEAAIPEINEQKEKDEQAALIAAALAKAKEDAVSELTALAGDKPGAEMTAVLNEAVSAVEAAADTEGVAAALEEGKAAIEEQIRLEKEYVFVTPTTSSTTLSKEIYSGETFAICVTNGSSSSAYTFTTTSGDESVAAITENGSVRIEAGKTANVKVKGIKQGIASITITNGNNWYARKVTINVTVKEDPEKVAAAVEEAKAVIEAVAIDEVRGLADEYIARIEKAETSAEAEALGEEGKKAIEAKILQNTKDRAEAEVNALAGENQTDGMKALVAALIAEIEAAESCEEVAAVLEGAQARIDAQNLKDAEEAAARALQQAKDNAKSQLEEAAGARKSSAMKELLEGIYDEIDNAENEEAIELIVDAALVSIEEQKEIDDENVIIEVVPTTSNPAVSYEMGIGETIQIAVTNGSSSNQYTFTTASSASAVANVVENGSVAIPAGQTEYVTVEGLKAGTCDITVSNGNSRYGRKATVHITVLEDPALTKAKAEAKNELLSAAGESEAGRNAADEYGIRIDAAATVTEVESLLTEGKAAVESAIKAEAEKVAITVTPSSNGATYSATIPAGSTLEITVKGSSYWGSSNYTISVADTGIAKVSGNTSVSVGTNASGLLKVQGVKSGSTVITIKDNSWWSPKSAKINLTVK